MKKKIIAAAATLLCSFFCCSTFLADGEYYSTSDLLLKSEDVIKVVTANSSTGLYYMLKNDGNVYGVVVSRADRNSPAEITSNAIVYNQADYGGTITDFNYAGESTTTFVRTTSKLYRMYMINSAECRDRKSVV